jgi:hypothetical protein
MKKIRHNIGMGKELPREKSMNSRGRVVTKKGGTLIRWGLLRAERNGNV